MPPPAGEVESYQTTTEENGTSAHVHLRHEGKSLSMLLKAFASSVSNNKIPHIRMFLTITLIRFQLVLSTQHCDQVTLSKYKWKNIGLIL